MALHILITLLLYTVLTIYWLHTSSKGLMYQIITRNPIEMVDVTAFIFGLIMAAASAVGAWWYLGIITGPLHPEDTLKAIVWVFAKYLCWIIPLLCMISIVRRSIILMKLPQVWRVNIQPSHLSREAQPDAGALYSRLKPWCMRSRAKSPKPPTFGPGDSS